MPVEPQRNARVIELAVAALKQTPLFRGVSWRLMFDFALDLGEVSLLDAPLSLQNVDLLVVTERPVMVSSPQQDIPAADALSLPPGVYTSSDPALQTGESVRADPSGTSSVFYVPSGQWGRISASSALARSLDPGTLSGALRAEIQEAIRAAPVEFSFVFLSPSLLATAPDQPLTAAYLFQHLVVAGVSRGPGRTLSIVLNDERQLVEEWSKGAREFSGEGADAVSARLTARSEELPPLDRVYVGFSPMSLAPGSSMLGATVHAHRLVYLTDETEEPLPEDLIAFLSPDLREHPGRYTSAVRVTLRADPPPRAERDLGAEQPRQPLGSLFDAAVRLLERRRHYATRSPRSWAGGLPRDAARIALDPEQTMGQFVAWSRQVGVAVARGEVPPFAANLFEAQPTTRLTAEQTGRALTNKLVGIAVSGGGVSAFRIGPLLEQLERPETETPVDFFAGVSGGALVGAYYCAGGTVGLRSLLGRMRRLRWLVPLLPLSSWPLEAWIDNDLEGVRVEDLQQTRFLPVTVELDGEVAPAAVVVAAGSLGEAVRASGSLPLAFGPTTKRGKRYADGAGAMIIPASVLPADVILACDAVPGPRHSNPLHDVRFMTALHDHTPVGRVLDAWTWMAFMMQNAAFFAGRGCDVYLAFERDKVPMRETLEWGRAEQIVEDARLDAAVGIAAGKLHELYTAPLQPVLGGPGPPP